MTREVWLRGGEGIRGRGCNENEKGYFDGGGEIGNEGDVGDLRDPSLSSFVFGSAGEG